MREHIHERILSVSLEPSMLTTLYVVEHICLKTKKIQCFGFFFKNRLIIEAPAPASFAHRFFFIFNDHDAVLLLYATFFLHHILFFTKRKSFAWVAIKCRILCSSHLRSRFATGQYFCWIKPLTSSLCVSLAVRLCVPTRSLVTRSVPVQSAGMLRCYLLPTDRHKFSIFLRFCGSHSKVSKEISERPIQKCLLFFFFFFSALVPVDSFANWCQNGWFAGRMSTVEFLFFDIGVWQRMHRNA